MTIQYLSDSAAILKPSGTIVNLSIIVARESVRFVILSMSSRVTEKHINDDAIKRESKYSFIESENFGICRLQKKYYLSSTSISKLMLSNVSGDWQNDLIPDSPYLQWMPKMEMVRWSVIRAAPPSQLDRKWAWPRHGGQVSPPRLTNEENSMYRWITLTFFSRMNKAYS